MRGENWWFLVCVCVCMCVCFSHTHTHTHVQVSSNKECEPGHTGSSNTIQVPKLVQISHMREQATITLEVEASSKMWKWMVKRGLDWPNIYLFKSLFDVPGTFSESLYMSVKKGQENAWLSSPKHGVRKCFLGGPLCSSVLGQYFPTRSQLTCWDLQQICAMNLSNTVPAHATTHWRVRCLDSFVWCPFWKMFLLFESNQ